MAIFRNNTSFPITAAIPNGTYNYINISFSTVQMFQFNIFNKGFCYLTISDGTNIEIVKATGIQQDPNTLSDALYVNRAQEGTTGQAWPSGTVLEIRLTNQGILEIDYPHIVPYPDLFTAEWYYGKEIIIHSPPISLLSVASEVWFGNKPDGGNLAIRKVGLIVYGSAQYLTVPSISFGDSNSTTTYLSATPVGTNINYSGIYEFTPSGNVLLQGEITASVTTAATVSSGFLTGQFFISGMLT